jgi:copper homeostasis protein
MQILKAMFSLEICAYSLESVLLAEAAGADRVELCAGRLEGGTTPSIGTIQLALQCKNIQVFPILRPRGGDFLYSDLEFKEMMIDLEHMKQQGVPGVVTGILLPNGRLDLERMRQLKAAAGDMEFCVHRAIDMSYNPSETLQELIDLGVTRVLSSGAANTALEGIEVLKQLVVQAENRIQIMAGSGINTAQIPELWSAGIRHFHASVSSFKPSKMNFRNPSIQMGKEGDLDEYAIQLASAEKISEMKSVLQQCAISH